MPRCSQVGGAARFEGQCLHPEGEQRHQNAPKWVPLRGEGKGRGMGRVPTGCVAAAGNSMRKNRSPPPTPEPILQNAKTHLSKALERQLAVFSVPDKAPQGFSVPQQRRNGSTPPQPTQGMGWEWASLVCPSPREVPKAPKQKTQLNKQTKTKTKNTVITS